MVELDRIGKSLLTAGVLTLVFLVPWIFFQLQNLGPYANVGGAYALFYGVLILAVLFILVGIYLMTTY